MRCWPPVGKGLIQLRSVQTALVHERLHCIVRGEPNASERSPVFRVSRYSGVSRRLEQNTVLAVEFTWTAVMSNAPRR
jgi:hypothetical protein